MSQLILHNDFLPAWQKITKPLIIFSAKKAGDSLGASLAIYHFLKKSGKEPTLFSPNFVLPKNYDFLTESSLIKTTWQELNKITFSIDFQQAIQPTWELEKEEKIWHFHFISPNHQPIDPKIELKNHWNNFDSLIFLGIDELSELGDFFSTNQLRITEMTTFAIDCKKENSFSGKHNLHSSEHDSLTEVVYDLIAHINKEMLDEKIATYLLTGLLEKNKGFKSHDLSSKSLHTAGTLVQIGADRQTIMENLFGKQTIGAIKLWGKILLNLEIFNEEKIAISKIVAQDFADTNTEEKDILPIIDELILSVKTVELTAIFFQKGNLTKCLIKSEKEIDLKKHFAEFSDLSGTTKQIIFSFTVSPDLIIEKLKSLI
ncbi:MAG: hypothetical protein WCT18_03650 [Patescibacteria group bacterium]